MKFQYFLEMCLAIAELVARNMVYGAVSKYYRSIDPLRPYNPLVDIHFKPYSYKNEC